MFTNLQKLEKEQESKEYVERRVQELEYKASKLQEDIKSYIKKITDKDKVIKD